jgi:ribosomal protein L3
MFEKGTHVDVAGRDQGPRLRGRRQAPQVRRRHASHGPTAGKQPGSIGSSATRRACSRASGLPGRMGGKNSRSRSGSDRREREQNVLLGAGRDSGPRERTGVRREAGSVTMNAKIVGMDGKPDGEAALPD